MNSWFQSLIVGTLIFTSVSILGYFTIVSDSGPFAVPGQQLPVFFERIEGIEEGSSVSVLGAPLGKVAGLYLVAVDSRGRPVPDDDPSRVALRGLAILDMKRSVILYENYKIRLRDETLLSGKAIVIDPGSAGDPGNPNRILSDPFLVSGSLSDKEKDEILLVLNRKYREGKDRSLGESPGDPLAALSDVFQENRSDVRRAVLNLMETTDKINRGKGSLGLFINDDGLYRRAHRLVWEGDITLRALREQEEDDRKVTPVKSLFDFAFAFF